MSDAPAFLRDARPRVPASATAAPARRAGSARVPGEAGIWVFILGDMLMFAAFFAAFLVQRGQDPEVFAQSREALTPAVGAANTLVLLTSSLLVAAAVRAHRAGRGAAAQRFVALAGACAAVFAVVKVSEWIVTASGGHDPGESLFFTYYYVLTGVHFLHLLIGSVVLAYWWLRLRQGPVPRRVVECCASYWHMVDLLWVVIFPVLYLAAT